MKPIKTIFKPFFLLVPAFAIYLISIASISCAQSKDEKRVKVKIVKTVDGETTTVEKTMDEDSVKDFTKPFENIEGKNRQVVITVEDVNKEKNSSWSSASQTSGKNKCASSMYFNFDMDSAVANSFSKIFKLHDSIGKNFTWNDSIFKNLPNLPKDFNFNFNFDDEGQMNNFDFDINTDDKGKMVIIKNNGRKTIVINEGEGDNEDADNTTISQSESGNEKSKSKTKTMVIGDDNSKNKKKVIVSTSVVVMDMDDKDNKSAKKKVKEDDNIKFYPNPSDGNFILDLDLNGKDEVFVLITDMNGKEVYKEKFSGNGKTSKTIDLGNDKKGTFIVSIKQGKKTSNKKIIIE